MAVPGFRSSVLATFTKLGIYPSSILDEECHQFLILNFGFWIKARKQGNEYP
jgi:hypothetical protein